jgi:hypothetical protein
MRGHVLEHGVKQRRHVATPFLAGRALFQRAPAVDARCVHHRKFQLLVGSAQVGKQIESFVNNLGGVGARFIHFVHHHNGLEAQRQCLLGDETGLGHGAFLRVNQQYHAIHHRKGPLNLAAKICMAGRVDDVDVRAFPAHRAVLGQNGNAALALNGIAVHHRVHDFFVLGEGARLA